MTLTDSDIQRIANQVAVNTRSLIIDEIDRKFRLPSGVVSGGPYNDISVNDQGLVTDARISTIGGEGCALAGSSQNITTGITTVLNFSATNILWNDTGYFDISGAPTLITINEIGRYVFFYKVGLLIAQNKKVDTFLFTNGLSPALLREVSELQFTSGGTSNRFYSVGLTVPWRVTAVPENYSIKLLHDDGFTTPVSASFGVLRVG